MNVKAKAPWEPQATPTFWINHASRLLMRHFERRLRPLDFGMAYMPVAVALEENGALLQRELAERAHVEQPTMAALLGRMQRDGLVKRTPHPGDKRAFHISLSAKAEARLPLAKEALREVAERALQGFTDRERATFLAMLRRVVDNLTGLGDDEDGAEP
ncbi:MarR family transcriptional regulator [Sorangium sp. So ce296]|uniref:MarR family winged helix-turn-helix transcriptional regulator n=1 Tax=Sorangium sp. So ce296 TaxID=3133296 RepID=UPI003F63CF8D